MTSKLEIYNEALAALGERKIASLTEDREPRRVLDDFYTGAMAYCLERGFWNWAIRTVQLDHSSSIDPPFGYSFAFTKPDDWVRTYVISANETLEPPLLKYVDEGGLWYADADPIYLRYVSSDTAWGMDLSLWPRSFAAFAATRLAARACKRITGSNAPDDLLRDEKQSQANALSKDAMDEPPGFPPTGSWVTSRGGGRSDRSRWNGQSS
jgi:hypothetical protein